MGSETDKDLKLIPELDLRGLSWCQWGQSPDANSNWVLVFKVSNCQIGDTVSTESDSDVLPLVPLTFGIDLKGKRFFGRVFHQLTSRYGMMHIAIIM